MKTTLHPHLLATIAFAGAFFLLHGQTHANRSLDQDNPPAPQAPLIVVLSHPGRLVEQHNPFIAPITQHNQSSTPQTMNGVIVNTPDQTMSSTSDEQFHLRAVVLGSRRYALMANGSSSQIVTVGSHIAGSVVSNISLNGVDLSNGAHFLPEESHS